MYCNRFKTNKNDNIIPYDDDDDDTPMMTIQAIQIQISAMLSKCTTLLVL